MAGASMNDIKARMKSVKSTMQITKAMELVATSKLRRAKENAERTRPFYKVLEEAIDAVMLSSRECDSVYSRTEGEGKTLFIVVAGDRGLAGGYNSGVIKLASALATGKDYTVIPVGKKALEYYRHRDIDIYSDSYEYASEVGVGASLCLGASVCEGYLSGKYDSVVLVYTKFVSMMTQTPTYTKLLPLSRTEKGTGAAPEFDGDIDEMLMKIVPEYVGGVIYSAMCESLASESGARRSAMNAANKNASEMIDELMLKYNRARQAVITQEITEIVSGAEAL